MREYRHAEERLAHQAGYNEALLDVYLSFVNPDALDEETIVVIDNMMEQVARVTLPKSDIPEGQLTIPV